MECTQTTWLSNKEYLKQFNQKVVEQRIPLSGSLGLTHQCNLRCLHCYLGDKTPIRRDYRKEFSTARWTSVIDEIAEAGCLYLLITGGEPLLRRDFAEIYSHAKTKGLLVTVFTNGTLITDRISELFEDLPPHAVEISLYGATAATYERITGVKGSYKQCLKGIQRLLDIQTNLKLKTILMTYNRHEFFDIENMAKAYGVKFRFDAAILPCLDGDKTPVELRVSPEEAIEKEFSDGGRLEQWKEYSDRMRGLHISEALYNCGAGLTTFHVEPYGNLQPCLMVNRFQYDLLQGSFSAGWRYVMPRIKEKQAGRDFACTRCNKRVLCSFCPAFFELENGEEDICSEFLCAMAQHRFRKIEDSLPR